jgi:hypothetical protein
MEEAGNLILSHPRCTMSEVRRHSGTHPCSAERVRAIVSPNKPLLPMGIWHIVQPQQCDGEGPRDEQWR